MKKIGSLLLLLLCLCTACRQTPQDQQTSQTAKDFAQVLSDQGLDGMLATKTLTGDPHEYVLSDTEGTMILYIYADADTASADAACISPDGFGYSRDDENGESIAVRTGWPDTPHFFRRENVIVRYIGTDAVLLSTLETLCGPQFAGG